MSGDAKQTGAASVLARRDVLKAMTGAGAAAMAVAVSEPAEAQQASERESRDERRKARYQPNSPDVQAFYRTNRY